MNFLGTIHILCHTNLGIFRHPPPATLCHKFKTTHPPTPNVWHHIMNFKIFCCFLSNNVLLMSFLASKWHPNWIARLFFDVKPHFFYNRAKLDIMKQNMRNVELFKKMTTLQEQSIHLSQKSKEPHPSCVTSYSNGPLSLKFFNVFFHSPACLFFIKSSLIQCQFCISYD